MKTFEVFMIPPGGQVKEITSILVDIESKPEANAKAKNDYPKLVILTKKTRVFH